MTKSCVTDLPGGVHSSDDECRESINLDTWLSKPDVIYAFPCKEVKENGYMVPRSVSYGAEDLIEQRFRPSASEFSHRFGHILTVWPNMYGLPTSPRNLGGLGL